MKKETWLFIGKDPRIQKSAELVKSLQRDVYYVDTDVWGSSLNELCVEKRPECIVFPIQPLTIGTDDEQVLIPEDSTLFFGRVSGYWNTIADQFNSYYYLQDEQFIWQNAKLTAEGLVAAFYEKNRKSISGKTFHVTGFGRVAKMLAIILKSMGAKVFIFVRSESNVCEAKAYGYDAAILSPEYFKRERISWLLNTIPAKWFTADYLSDRYPRMFIYDLASSPGCLMEVNVEDYELLPGLPGHYFADDAAELLSKTVISLYNLEKEQRNA